jgi:hypothetical protein
MEAWLSWILPPLPTPLEKIDKLYILELGFEVIIAVDPKLDHNQTCETNYLFWRRS